MTFGFRRPVTSGVSPQVLPNTPFILVFLFCQITTTPHFSMELDFDGVTELAFGVAS